MSCCFLDEETFQLCCQLLLKHSNHLGDGWSWEQRQGSEEGYLRKTIMRSVIINSNPDHGLLGSSPTTEHQRPSQTGSDPLGQEKDQLCSAATVTSDDEDDGVGDDDDGLCCVSEGSSRALQCEYHILYSCSYQTPVLYFRASTLEGRSLSLEEVWSSVHANYRLRLQQSPWDTITQQEHPLLGQAFFMLHPCRTEEFMKPVLQAAQREHRQVNYVVTWLSVVGPVVGLDVPLSYSTRVPAPPERHPAPGTEPD